MTARWEDEWRSCNDVDELRREFRERLRKPTDNPYDAGTGGLKELAEAERAWLRTLDRSCS